MRSQTGGLKLASRQIVLDTETTGLNARMGDRVIEIGCIELLSRNVTDRQFHSFLNPEREIDEGAAKVHGLTLATRNVKDVGRTGVACVNPFASS